MRWWEKHHAEPAFRSFAGRKATLHNYALKAKYREYLLLGNAHARHGCREGLSLEPGWMVPGYNTGHTALNLAVQLGATLILLLGFDMRWLNGRSHFHDGHPFQAHEDGYPLMIQAFNATVEPLAKLGVRVINCSPISRLECFTKLSLSEALSKVQS